MFETAKLAVMDYRTWILTIMQHCVVLSQTVTFFFPSVVNTLGFGKIETLLLTALVWVTTFIFNLFILWSVSRTGERCFNLIGSLLVTVVGNIMLITIRMRGPRFLGMFLMAMDKVLPSHLVCLAFPRADIDSGAQPAFMIILTWTSNTFPCPLGKRTAVIDFSSESSGSVLNLLILTDEVEAKDNRQNSTEPADSSNGCSSKLIHRCCAGWVEVGAIDVGAVTNHVDDSDNFTE